MRQQLALVLGQGACHESEQAQDIRYEDSAQSAPENIGVARARRRKKGAYTKGEINRLIDSFLHPHMRGERKASVVILDAVAHALVEQDPGKSFRGFVKYGLPKLLEEGEKENRGNRRNVRADSPVQGTGLRPVAHEWFK